MAVAVQELDRPVVTRTRPAPCASQRLERLEGNARTGRAREAVYRRRRAVVASVVMVVVLLCASVASRPLASWMGGTDTSSAGHPALVVVGPGDTVWDYALRHAPAGTEPHDWVAQVAALNDVEPRTLRPGEVLRFPPP